MNVFITGVTSGLGKALAREFLNKGYSVWGAGRRNLEESDKNFYYSVCDIGKEEEVGRVYGEMKNRNFVPDIVILNAAIMKDDLIPEFSYPIFKEIFNTNIFGAIKWIDVFLPLFLERKRGIFVAISSLSAYRPLNISKIAYPSSKAALSMAFRALRVHFTSSGLRFITFHIGRMEEKDGLIRVSYQKAAARIAKHLHFNKKSDVVDFPYIPTLITRISRFFPDTFIPKP